MAEFTLKQEPLPGTITYDWLIKHDACSQAETFKEMYPGGTDITEEVVDELLEEGIDLEFLIGAAYGIYEEGFQDHFHKKTEHAFKHHEETADLLLTLYDKARREFARERVLALYEIARCEDLATQEGEQWRIDYS